jgi:hypothetical protein
MRARGTAGEVGGERERFDQEAAKGEAPRQLLSIRR